MMLIVLVAIALPVFLLLAAWFAGPPSELLPAHEHALQSEDPDEVWLIAPWWVL